VPHREDWMKLSRRRLIAGSGAVLAAMGGGAVWTNSRIRYYGSGVRRKTFITSSWDMTNGHRFRTKVLKADIASSEIEVRLGIKRQLEKILRALAASRSS